MKLLSLPYLCLALWSLLSVAWAGGPPGNAPADVVVIVDTSTSMTRTGMDPERASLLVTRLLADIVPGDLAVVRLIGVDDIVAEADGQLVQVGATSGPECPPPCMQWAWKDGSDEAYLESMRGASRQDLDAYGVLDRREASSIGQFNKSLDGHLVQQSTNSNFLYSFIAAGTWLGLRREEADREQVIVWLSDGDSDSNVSDEVRGLHSEDVEISALVFGAGTTQKVRAAGLKPVQVRSPKEIMGAFTGAFRTAMGAPFGGFDEIATDPSFEIKPYVDEAWVVVYGKSAIHGATLRGPDGVRSVDGAADVYGSAGAYRTVYLESPREGRWTISASGGGEGVAYAVIQRLDIVPEIIEPKQAMATVPTTLVVGLFSKGGRITDPDILREMSIQVEVDGRRVELNDQGRGEDDKAGDGQFTGTMSFPLPGNIEVEIDAQSPLLVRSSTGTVEVISSFEYTGGPIHIDLGTLTEDDESCKALDFSKASEQTGPVPFALKLLDSLPDEHTLEIRMNGEILRPEEGSLEAPVGASWEVCLITGDRARITESDEEDWLRLHFAGSTQDKHAVPIQLSWKVDGLTWWDIWGPWILALLALLVLLIIIYGYIRPSRFPRGLAIVLCTEEDMDEGSRYPVSQHKGTGIGFYRDARVCIASDYRIMGDSRFSRAKGAVVSLRAHKRLIRIRPVGGNTIETLNADDDWEAIPTDKESMLRFGNVYRLAGHGELYFEVRRG